jgi:adenine C2-methylase RlmN of 23S rRNA A2503 and tRNA A37
LIPYQSFCFPARGIEKGCPHFLLKPQQVLASQDGAKKYIFSLEDGGMIESVLIPEAGV